MCRHICLCFFFQMIRRPPRSTHCISSAASDVYKRQGINAEYMGLNLLPVTLYQGQLDLELTNSGQQQIIYDLNWSGLEKFRGAQKQVWRKYEPPNNDVLGNYKTSDNLTFAIVYGAGHISGGDKPDTIYDLVFREVNERWDN
eukprot:TRINITY_DN22130_c0_g1_i1.p3 TRINITY_DN22130_c0_g1~~TRINITY_DN22130_c0_g1_i1.p3  ORF type:complete len:143 (+),score=41.15 TRINITY_DN22130_c0_g1_i1:46-474(+)